MYVSDRLELLFLISSIVVAPFFKLNDIPIPIRISFHPCYLSNIEKTKNDKTLEEYPDRTLRILLRLA